jgi:thymidine phosphorylase
MALTQHTLNAVAMGIDTHQEPVAYMRQDCHICRSEGLVSNTRILLRTENNELIVTLNVVRNDKLLPGEIGLSDIAFDRLQCRDSQKIAISHAPVVTSLSYVRKKIFGSELTASEITEIIKDISKHNYSDIEIASFLSACAGPRMSEAEIVHLTNAMVSCGRKLSWGEHKKIFDKHCIGGLPGNRTTPIVVSIASAAGLIIPKTSSRAITSPAGTADTMECLANVNLDVNQIENVVAKTGACLAWGGAVNLSPADDMLIRIERALNIDGEGQLIASVLSKKIAAGSTYVIIDIPVGKTAKVRSQKDAARLAQLFTKVGNACHIKVRCVITDGSKPIGAGIGPCEEAKDILSVLACSEDAPQDLREKSLFLAANLFDMNDGLGINAGRDLATSILDSGQALGQFNNIILAQGERKSVTDASHQFTEVSEKSGTLIAIDNRKLARFAKLAGAPFSLNSGLRLHINVGSQVHIGQSVFTLFSDSQGEMAYALDYYHDNADIFIFKD